MKAFLISAINKMKYADTFHIEIISILGSLFYFPNLLIDCSVQEDFIRYFFYVTGVVGIIGLWKESLHWRHLHVQYMMISYLIPLGTIVSRNLYHPMHLRLFLFQLILSIYLVWRIGTEKLHKRMKERTAKGCQNG